MASKYEPQWEPSYLVEQAQEGLYVAAFFSDETQRLLAEYMAEHKIPNPIPAPSLHTTIVYSKVPVPDFDQCDFPLEITVDPAYCKIETWETPTGGKCVVLRLVSPYLELRFQEAMAAGATYDFEEYKAHISLTYEPGDFDASKLPTPNFPIVIAGEYSEPLDLGEA